MLRLVVLSFFTSLILIGCKNTDLKNLNEGYIEYSIEYNQDEPTSYANKLKPSLMVVKFRENNTVNQIEGLSGAVSFAFIQDIEAQKTYTLIKLFSKELVYEEVIRADSYPFAYLDMPKFTIQHIDETEEFLGVNCKKAHITFIDTLLHPFEILYTQDLSIENPNFNTPFEEIDGVMLKFSVILFNQKMKIVATRIKGAKISADEFKVPAYYEKIDQETVKDVITLLQ
jgi:hypothetical protein